jgi:hypothetical protein
MTPIAPYSRLSDGPGATTHRTSWLGELRNVSLTM